MNNIQRTNLINNGECYPLRILYSRSLEDLLETSFLSENKEIEHWSCGIIHTSFDHENRSKHVHNSKPCKAEETAIQFSNLLKEFIVSGDGDSEWHPFWIRVGHHPKLGIDASTLDIVSNVAKPDEKFEDCSEWVVLGENIRSSLEKVSFVKYVYDDKSNFLNIVDKFLGSNHDDKYDVVVKSVKDESDWYMGSVIIAGRNSEGDVFGIYDDLVFMMI